MVQPDFLQKPFHEMTSAEWESLCDGCGLCCQLRLEDEDTGEVVLSNIACDFLDLETCRCSDYENRQKNVPDCVKITPDNVAEMDWLPVTCGYRLVWGGYELPEWHHLVCGKKNRVHTQGPSMKGDLVHEKDSALFDDEDDV
jgi:uncharacterized cysteine cluster protein YcgN (CxxCxxCC family)